jgi:hypothetical protein
MKTLNLIRDLSTPSCTLGWLTFGQKKWATIERPWIPSNDAGKGGLKSKSCVPCGAYKITPHDTEAFPKVWALQNPALDVYHWPADVPVSKQAFARTAVLIHVANWAHELRGCIAVGTVRAKDNNDLWMVKNSRDAINQLRTVLGSGDFTLVIESN